MEKLKEIRWHGRGGQGAWTASEILAKAAILEGKYIQSFPEFGPERMGAPVNSYTRISDKPINLHCSVYNPDAVAVLDPTLLKAVPVIQGLKEHGTLLVNTEATPTEIREQLDLKSGKVWTVPATKIAMKILGRPITNTAMVGAVAKATKIVSLESIKRAAKGRFPSSVAEKNIAIIEQAYEEAQTG
ncbi:pyruvate ferredoxin oxidoreductase subunit gamma [Candidatus Bathyarchaeota archaeon]|nr:pyruvate ferredoxin oxidoreductase subunit gamma [Candidatus Bathyarchaeota archaeon]NIU38830.1 pyruvate ferredoxin oxidoreductase subunit gamma [Candidatus Bathyarchaeota archaeon]NIV43850.1 pyruvate ferredoxin oxidoreductase subunit gamma [Candidatus Bathyarchaeota archaeon]UCC27705.1 MAG: pyruvate ferredoxin oxidoreductase subunit gamma [Candidatus Bathyarchaeota archaeon]UCD39826.1 MAG: pyruvate ferredoxin oxidoreductase subunit gamma [Candidatus Bathyarchaeota archaeon]